VTVDHGAPEPAYQQLAAILRAKIAKGEWRNGPLPSVKQLQQEHDVGRDTVLRAVEILRDEGLVFTVPRRGTYVTSLLRWAPPGDHTVSMQPNNPQVATRHVRQAERL
jgi:DNA-binding GntR family transcriptional regulator